MNCSVQCVKGSALIPRLLVLLALPAATLAWAQPSEPTANAEAAASEPMQPAISLGLSSPLGPPTDAFNDTRTQGYVLGSLRYVPDVNAAYFYETNPLKTSANAPGDAALATYATVTVRDAGSGPRKFFAGVAQTRWNSVSLSADPRRRVTFEDRYRLGDWQVPVRLGYNFDTVSRSSFLARQVNSELKSTQYTGSVAAIRNLDTRQLALTLQAENVAIGSAVKADGTAFVSSNSYVKSLARIKGTQALSETAGLYLQAELENYNYSATGVDYDINPTSRVMTGLFGVQQQFSSAFGFSADVGVANKSSGRRDLVPGARHSVGSVNGSFNPSPATRAYVAYVVAVAELNDSGISNLLTNTWAVGWSHKLSPSMATNLTYDRTKIMANEAPGNVVDSKFFVTLQYKPSPSVLASFAISRTQRQVVNLTDFVRPFVNTRYLINLTYYL